MLTVFKLFKNVMEVRQHQIGNAAKGLCSCRSQTGMILLVLLLTSTFCGAEELRIKSGDKIAFPGASITQFAWSNQEGYIHLVVNGLKAEGVEVTPNPAGISGNRSNQILERIQRDVIDKHPQWMTFKVAGNDVWSQKIPLEQFQKNVTEAVDKVTAAGIKVMFITQTPLGEDASDPRNIRLAAYNKFIRNSQKNATACRQTPILIWQMRFPIVKKGNRIV